MGQTGNMRTAINSLQPLQPKTGKIAGQLQGEQSDRL